MAPLSLCYMRRPKYCDGRPSRFTCFFVLGVEGMKSVVDKLLGGGEYEEVVNGESKNEAGFGSFEFGEQTRVSVALDEFLGLEASFGAISIVFTS